jgi:murein L,D-transpeptidase YafK
MKKVILTVLIGLSMLSFTGPGDFLTAQKKFERVRVAIKQKHATVEKIVKKHGYEPDQLNLLLVAYKDNDVLDVYGKFPKDKMYRKIHSYKVCSRSGGLGPKRKEGDGQVPEGFYHIDRFNPNSQFYLSLGINYPNLADRRRSREPRLGGDIFIHGSCVTIGCLPLTDDLIKEVYLLAVYARDGGQTQIPVYLFPFRMTDKNMTIYRSRYRDNPQLLAFWENLKIGHDKFMKYGRKLKVQVNSKGDYEF